VIGGRGFIGHRAVDALRERGHDVWTLGRTSAEGQHLVGDRSRPEGLAQALGRRRFEAIVDLAAFQPGEVRDAVELFRDSVRRYVFVSSGAVYQRGTGSDEEQAPILEGDPPDMSWTTRWASAGANPCLRGRLGTDFPASSSDPRRPRRERSHKPSRRISGTGRGWGATPRSGGALRCCNRGRVEQGRRDRVHTPQRRGGTKLRLQRRLCGPHVTALPQRVCSRAWGPTTGHSGRGRGRPRGRAAFSFRLLPVQPRLGASRRVEGSPAREELGFEASSLRAALDECVSWFRSEQPELHGYERRGDELELARRLSSARSS
jgi:hypothetical protein